MAVPRRREVEVDQAALEQLRRRLTSARVGQREAERLREQITAVEKGQRPATVPQAASLGRRRGGRPASRAAYDKTRKRNLSREIEELRPRSEPDLLSKMSIRDLQRLQRWADAKQAQDDLLSRPGGVPSYAEYKAVSDRRAAAFVEMNLWARMRFGLKYDRRALFGSP